MTEPFEVRFTAPEAGTYHVVSGQPPHLLFSECTLACGTLTPEGNYTTVTVRMDTKPADHVPVELHRADSMVAVFDETELSVAGDTIYSQVQWIELPVETNEA